MEGLAEFKTSSFGVIEGSSDLLSGKTKTKTKNPDDILEGRYQGNICFTFLRSPPWILTSRESQVHPYNPQRAASPCVAVSLDGLGGVGRDI